MKKYVKKPIVVEALRLVLTDGGIAAAKAFCPHLHQPIKGGCCIIPTLEGDMIAQEGDYIIKGVKGEFYPCKSDIFRATYDEVQEGGK